MSDWTYPVMELRTGGPVLDHLPVKVDSFSDQLGVAVGSMSGSLPVGAGPVPADEALLPDGRPSRVIVPCYNTRPVGAYLVTALGQYRARQGAIAFTAERVDCLLKRRRIWSTLQFIQQDQLDIARALVGYAIGLSVLPGLDTVYAALMSPLVTAARLPWWTLDPSVSGVLRDRLDNDSGYQMQANMIAADALRNLSELVDSGARAAAGLDGSFDYRLDYTRDSVTGALGVTVRFGYPRLGRVDPLPLEWPGNIADWTYAVDTSDSETQTRIFGAGSGVERTMGPVATDQDAHNQGWPLLMGSGTSNASEPVTLDEQGEARLAKFRLGNEGWSISVAQDQIGTWELGDNVQGRIRDQRWPDLKVFNARIVGQVVHPSRQGKAGTVDLMLAPLR